MTASPSLTGPIFKFSRETNAVRVENIPQNVNRLEILSLFRTLIGEIRSSQDLDDALEITFFTGDNARKALCMAGYNVAGNSLVVTPIVRSASPASSNGGQNKRNDSRRNLYVLGIPFGMTNQGLADMFSVHGTVSHSVILATLDGASRRRGFVVMASHQEARRAMSALGRNGKAGAGGLDISWAVVQRSKGFLDGGDRAGVVPSPACSIGSPSPVFQSTTPTQSSQSLPAVSSCPTAMISVSNLPLLLFSTEDDLRGLVCPFGTVKSLRLIPTSPKSSSSTTSALIHYTSIAAAQDARRSLAGESYANCILRVAFLVDPDVPSVPTSPFPDSPIPVELPSRGCVAPGPVKTVFDGRNVSNYIVQDAYDWERPVYNFPQYSPYFGYNELPRWIPSPTLYGRIPSRDLGYCV
ncbi:RRM domain-containing protein [Mycena kentingensis (nom. inval.)]|nr:RRM domain-containing protein [Mycena kentingensis (nom. inval.)]